MNRRLVSILQVAAALGAGGMLAPGDLSGQSSGTMQASVTVVDFSASARSGAEALNAVTDLLTAPPSGVPIRNVGYGEAGAERIDVVADPAGTSGAPRRVRVTIAYLS